MFHFFDRTRIHELSNGFRVYGFFRPGVSTEIQIHVGTGSIHEGKDLGCGLSHFLEHMLFQGCKGYPGNRISDEVNRLGGEVNAFTGVDQTCYYMRMPRENWRDAVKMLSAMVRFPELPEERFRKEREVILRECERGMDNPGNRLYHAFLRTLFLQHPLRHPVIGYPDKIASVTREMALAYHELRYTPGRTFALLVGEFDFDAVIEEMERSFGSWERGDLAEIPFSPEPFPSCERSAEIIFPDTLSREMSGIRLPAPESREFAAMSLLFNMLGTGDSSLLFSSLVLEKKAAQSVGTFQFPQGDESIGGIVLEAEPGKMQKASDLLKKELEKAAKGEFSAARMEREKIQQTADAVHDCYDVDRIAKILSSAIFYGKTPLAADRCIDDMQHLEVDDLRRAAAEYLDSSRIVRVQQVSAPAKQSRKTAVSPLRVEQSATRRKELLLQVPDHSLPMASFSLLLPGGNIFEEPGKHGVSVLCSALLRAGCRRYPEKTLLAKLDRCGADFNANSGANSLLLHLSAPRNRFPAAVQIVSELLSAPLFGEKEFLREKQRLLESIRSRSLSPLNAAIDASSDILYGKHPYACWGRGFREEIAALTPDDVARFYASRFCRKQLIFGFSGNLSAAEAEGFADMISAALPSAEAPCRMVKPPVFPETLRESSFTLPRSQTVVLREFPGITGRDPESLNCFRILREMENGLSSVLFREVREKHALCYSVGMYFVAGFHPGTIAFYSMTTPEAAEKVLSLLEKEIGRLARGEVSAAEFEAARRCAAQQYGQENDDPEAVLKTAMLERHYGNDPALPLYRAKEIAGITLERFLQEITPCFRHPVGTRVIVTPEKK